MGFLKSFIYAYLIAFWFFSGFKMIISNDLDDAAEKAVAVAEIYSQATKVTKQHGDSVRLGEVGYRSGLGLGGLRPSYAYQGAKTAW